jgi:hypothetical protein
MSRLSGVQVELTKDEAEFLRCYREMDLRSRIDNMKTVQSEAEKYPMIKRPIPPKSPAGIRLVAAFGKGVSA